MNSQISGAPPGSQSTDQGGARYYLKRPSFSFDLTGSVLGLDSSAIGTLVERTTRFTMLLHLPRINEHGQIPAIKNGSPLAQQGAEAVRNAIVTSIAILPDEL